MSAQPSPSVKISFGPFEYDGLSGDLRKYGNRIRLGGKPLQILSLLLDRPGEVIGRDELQRHLWEGTTFVDFEQGLNSAVNKLRQALGDSADLSRYVETLPGRGYRFIAPVHQPSTKTVLEMVAPGLPKTVPDPAPLAMEPPRNTNWWRPFVAGVAVTLIALGGSLLVRRGPEPVRTLKPAKFTITPPPGFALEAAASRQSFALSPDGARLGFSAMDTSGEFSLFLRDFNSLDSRLVANSKGVHTLFWPPDGQSLYLTNRGQLWRAPVEGDAHVVLGDSPSFLFSGAWLNSGSLLLSSSKESFSISSSGGPLQPTRQLYLWPEILPDGEHVLSIGWDTKTRRYRARVSRFDDPASAKDLFESDSRVMYTPSIVTPGEGYLMYVRGGNLLARRFDSRALQVNGEAMPVASKIYAFAPTGAADFSVSAKGSIAYHNHVSRSQLAWVDRTGRLLSSIGPANIDVKSARLSPDGRSLVTAIYDVNAGQQDLWIFDVKTNTGRRMTLDSGLRDAPVWSPNSKTLAFLHAAGGRRAQVHIRGLGEKDTEESMKSPDFQMPSDWSPDGRFIAFGNTGVPRTENETQGDVWVIDLARGRTMTPLLNTPFHEGNAAFSPDGKWLAFTSNESGRPEVYVQAFQTSETPRMAGERFLVSRNGAQALRWRRDGKELFFLGFDGQVQAVRVKLSPNPEFSAAIPLFTISTEARAAIHSVLGFDVSADGRRFVVPVAASSEAPSLVVIQNWEAALPPR